MTTRLNRASVGDLALMSTFACGRWPEGAAVTERTFSETRRRNAKAGADVRVEKSMIGVL